VITTGAEAMLFDELGSGLADEARALMIGVPVLVNLSVTV
jgi:hypothetical protein